MRKKKKTKPKHQPPLRKEFNCDESRLYALAGDILYTGANEYKLAGMALRRVERMKELGYYVEEFADDAKAKAEETEYQTRLTQYLAERAQWKKEQDAYKEAIAIHELAMNDFKEATKWWLLSGKRGAKPKKPKKPRAPKTEEPIAPIHYRHIVPERLRKPLYKELVREYQSIMTRERAFILSDRFQIIIGNSEHTGRTILQELDRIIEEYDPTPFVPELDPETGNPYAKKAWKKILEQRRRTHEPTKDKAIYKHKKIPKGWNVKTGQVQS